MYLKRKIDEYLLEWKKNEERLPLIIKGARQIGKTESINHFAEQNYSNIVSINFVLEPKYKTILSDGYAVEDIIKNISMIDTSKKFIAGDTVIIFDELQEFPDIATALKSFRIDGRFDVITSGSLLGLTYGEDADENTEEPESVPTGYEMFLTMYSLDFEEFLWAEGYENGISYLRELFDNKEKVPFALNEKYETLFREYMVVGGMPEVVADYVENHDFTKVAAIQEKILENYRFDISKHAKGAEKIKVRRCYEAIPRQLAKEITKFQYSTVEKGQTSKKYGGSIQWLKDSNIVNPCYNIHEPYLPLMANADENQFKLYINDTGLLCAMYGFETKKAVLENVIKGNAKGGIYENIIAEILVKNGYELYYYKPDDSNELEFLIEKNGEVIPVEVKAGNTATKSLNRFIEKYKPTVAYKIVDGNVGVNENKLTIPHYMVMFL